MQKAPKRFLVLKVITPHMHRADALSNMQEIRELINTFGGKLVVEDIQHKVKPHPATYIGPGKVSWLKRVVKEKKIDVVVINDIVKAGQLFRLESVMWEVNHLIKVWDRVDLILNIFEKHATTTEAKLQIELAKVEHDAPRIYGLGATELHRQGGGIGTRGLGETNIERERRLLKNRTRELKKKIDKIAGQKRARMRRRKSGKTKSISLVGYTSAGKTTLFNALTGKHKETHKGFFTTLDTVVGKVKMTNGEHVVVSDTIGFIQELPPKLISAFKTTLLESLESDLVLHVIDISDNRIFDKIEVVDSILEELNVDAEVILVFNKVDKVKKNDRVYTQIKRIYDKRQTLYVSAYSGKGIDDLKTHII